jgi:hypothetical protein
MLKAAIIYLQGSGGNLLSRVLTLSPQTIAYLPKEFSQRQHYFKIGAFDRYQLYNNWNSKNWTQTENDIRLWYHCGSNDFVNYESSAMFLIDQFHPCMFDYENKRSLLWTKESRWQHLIFIRYRPESFGKIVSLASKKRPDLDHAKQIYSKELDCMETLIETHQNRLEIWWEDMLKLNSFLDSTKIIADKLQISLDWDLASNLWNKWHQQTALLL